MTVKNFLKTAVLGIAFCSVLGMNNSSIAMDNNNILQQNEQYKQILRDIINPLRIDTEFCGDLRPTKSYGMDFSEIQRQPDKLSENALQSIIRVIHRAIDDELDSEDLDILNDSIKKLKTVKHSYVNHQYDSETILVHSETIIDAVTNRYKNNNIIRV